MASIFVKDTFTDTVGTALVSHTGETGATWTKTSYSNATNQILIGSANTAYGSATAGEGVWLASGNPTGPDYSVQADFVNKSAIGGQDMSILGRLSSGGTAFYYAARWNEANNQIELFKNIAGVFTTLGTPVNIGLAVGHTVTVRLSMGGTNISVWASIDGGAMFQYISTTDSSLTGSGNAGIRSVQAGTTTTGTHLDNFSAFTDSYWVGGSNSLTQPTYITDNFTDTAAINLSAHTADSGSTWTLHPQTPTGSILVSNANRIMGNLAGDSLYYNSFVPTTANYTVKADFFCVTNSGAIVHFCGRMDTTAKTFYMCRYDGANIALYKCVAGTYTQLGSNVAGVLSAGQAYSLQLVMVGNKISVQQNGTALIAVTDSSITAAGRAGVLISSAETNTTGFHIDNFRTYANNWAASSGGNPSLTYAPDTTANVVFDTNSGTNPVISMDKTMTVNSFTATNGISLSDHENTAKPLLLTWPGNNPVTTNTDLTLYGDVEFQGTSGSGGFIMAGTGTFTQYSDSMIPYVGINGSGITVTCNAGTPGGAGVWYQTNFNIGYLDLLQGTLLMAEYDFGDHPQQNPIYRVDTFSVSNSTNTRTINWNGNLIAQQGTKMYIGKAFDASVTTGLTFSNIGVSQFHFDNTSSYVYDSFGSSLLQELSTHTADTGNTWTNTVGSKNMVFSSAGRVFCNGSAAYIASGFIPTEDYIIESDLYVASNNGGFIGVEGRAFTSTDTCYVFGYDGSGTPHWQITAVSAGVSTGLATVNAALNVGQTYHIKLQMVGNVISGYVDGVLVAQVNDNSVNGFYGLVTQAGIRGGTVAATDTTGYHLDNFSVTRYQPYTLPMTFNGGGLTYYGIYLDNAVGRLTIGGNNTMAKLTTVAGSVCTLSGSNTITAWTVNPGTSWILGSGQTQTGTFTSTLQGTNNNNISFIASTPGSQAFINVGGSYMTVYMISFTDIMVTGGGRIVDYRGFDGGDNTNIIFMNGVVKYYTYDVYKPISRSTSTTVNPPVFVGQYSDVVTDPQFSQQINNPGGQMTIQRGVDPTNFGEGTLVDYNNYVVVKAFTEDYPNGVTIFLGFISSYTPNIEAGNQYVEIILLAYGAEFSQYLTIADPVVDVQNGSDPSVYPAHQQSDSVVYLSQKFTTGGGVTNLFQVIAQWMQVGSGFGDQSMIVEICPDDGSGAPNRNSILYSSTNSPYFVGYISPLAITVSAGTAYHVVFHNPNGLTVNSYACVAGSAGNKLRKSSTGANGSWSDESHGYALANFATYTSSGNTTVTYSGTNIRTVMLDVMSNYNIQGGIISADTTTLDDPGTTMTYTFKSNTVLEAIQKCVDFAPAGWYWYVDVSTNKLHFHKGATVPKHYVTLGKNVMSVQLQKTMETVINSVLVTGGNDGSGFNLFRNYFNTASQGRYGRRTELYNDSNITTTAQALAVATKIITQYKNPTSRAPVTILGQPGDGYNIESIRPGDIFFVQGLQGAVNLQCSRVDYKAYSADLDASTIPPQINNTLEDTQNAVEQQQSNLNPTAPTQVAVA